MNNTEYKKFLEDKMSFVETLIATEKDKTSLMGYHNTKALLKEIIDKFSEIEIKDNANRKVYYFNVYSGNGYLADGVVIADNETDAMLNYNLFLSAIETNTELKVDVSDSMVIVSQDGKMVSVMMAGNDVSIGYFLTVSFQG